MLISSKCLYCAVEFDVLLKELNRGNGKYCSRSCSNKARSLVPKAPNRTCAWCGERFYRRPSSVSKSGLYFCCRKHKDCAQRTNGIKDIQPDHYGSGHSVYRLVAFRSLPKRFNRCGYDTIEEVLEVHHVDRNKQNNTLENLEILCPTCHREEHYLASDGSFRGYSETGITSVLQTEDSGSSPDTSTTG